LLGLPGEVAVFGEVKPEPDIPNLESALAMAERVRPELVVGFGGGSAMDLAKLVAVLPGSGQAIHDVVGPEKVTGAGRAGAGAHHLRHRQRGRHPRPGDGPRDAEQARRAEPAHAGGPGGRWTPT
jgi:hypothetical protein